MEHAWDDIDLGELASPVRPGSHRRSRSDPSAMLQSIRKERDGASAIPPPPQWEALGAMEPGPLLEAVAKRNLSPAKATGFSPAMKKHTSVAPNHNQRTSLLPPAFEFADAVGDMTESAEPNDSSSVDKDADDANDDPIIMPPSVSFPLAGGLVVPSADEFESAGNGEKAPKNYSKKDVPMWTVEEDLLILQLVEQHGKRWSKIARTSRPHRQRRAQPMEPHGARSGAAAEAARPRATAAGDARAEARPSARLGHGRAARRG